MVIGLNGVGKIIFFDVIIGKIVFIEGDVVFKGCFLVGMCEYCIVCCGIGCKF